MRYTLSDEYSDPPQCYHHLSDTPVGSYSIAVWLEAEEAKALLSLVECGCVEEHLLNNKSGEVMSKVGDRITDLIGMMEMKCSSQETSSNKPSDS